MPFSTFYRAPFVFRKAPAWASTVADAEIRDQLCNKARKAMGPKQPAAHPMGVLIRNTFAKYAAAYSKAFVDPKAADKPTVGRVGLEEQEETASGVSNLATEFQVLSTDDGDDDANAAEDTTVSQVLAIKPPKPNGPLINRAKLRPFCYVADEMTRRQASVLAERSFANKQYVAISASCSSNTHRAKEHVRVLPGKQWNIYHPNLLMGTESRQRALTWSRLVRTWFDVMAQKNGAHFDKKGDRNSRANLDHIEPISTIPHFVGVYEEKSIYLELVAGWMNIMSIPAVLNKEKSNSAPHTANVQQHVENLQAFFTHAIPDALDKCAIDADALRRYCHLYQEMHGELTAARAEMLNQKKA